MIETFSLGDRVILKKPHACGENLWEIVRMGAASKTCFRSLGSTPRMERSEEKKPAVAMLTRDFFVHRGRSRYAPIMRP